MATIYQNGIQYSGSGEPLIYDDMGGATSTTGGVHGLVPAPSAGDNEKFLSGDGSWKKPGEYITKTASGNPITFDDGASAPLVKCVSAITGSQDLHGYDKPWVGGAGKNKVEPTFTQSTTLNGIKFTPQDDGSVIAENVDTHTIPSRQCCGSANLSAGEYILNGSIMGSASTYYVDVSLSEVDDTYIAYTGNNDAAFTLSESATVYIRCVVATNGLRTLGDKTTFYPMIRLATVTDPTFEPYSNICPITAYTEGEIEVRGKNIALLSNGTQMQYSAQSVSFTDDGGVFTSIGTYSRSLYKIEIEPIVIGKKYTISFKGKSTGNYNNIYFGSENVLRSSDYGDKTLTSTETEYQITFTAVSKDLYITFYVTSTATSGVMTISEFQIESGEVKTDFELYKSPTTHATTYPSAIYRGSEDVVNGEVSYDIHLIDLGDLTWNISSNIFYASVTGIKRPSTTGEKLGAICSHYEIVTQAVAPSTTNECISGLNWIDGIALWNSNYTTGEEVKAAMTGVKMAFQLATPTTSSVTPTNLPIKSLSGYNHIESSTGEMEIEYITSEYQPLVDLIESGKHEYSTNEQVVGIWIDGKVLYEKTVSVGSISIGSGGSSKIATLTGADTLVSANGYIVESGTCFMVPEMSMRIRMDSDKDVYLNTSSSWTITSGYVILRYTKATENS